MSPEEVERFRVMWLRDVPVHEIAQVLGYSVSTLRAYACNHRDEFPYRRKPTTQGQRDLALALLSRGDMTTEQVARRVKVSTAQIRRWRMGHR